jgi:hypothetical protein
MDLSKWHARRAYEDDGYEIFFNGVDLVFLRKSDGKILALPGSDESHALHQQLADMKRNFIGHALRDFVTDSKWLTPKQAGMKPKRPRTFEDDFIKAA